MRARRWGARQTAAPSPPARCPHAPAACCSNNQRTHQCTESLLKMPSKLIRILRITFCYKQLCGRCLVHMTPVVKLVIHCVFALLYAKYISDNLIYKEQRACRLTVPSRMSTNTGNRGPLKRMNTTPYVRHIVPLL